jgi:hypothetical protein
MVDSVSFALYVRDHRSRRDRAGKRYGCRIGGICIRVRLVILALYADHATSEQFHSEFKTDLDVERLPSGKFASNVLVLACVMLPCNILRWLGQTVCSAPMPRTGLRPNAGVCAP